LWQSCCERVLCPRVGEQGEKVAGENMEDEAAGKRTVEGAIEFDERGFGVAIRGWSN
jgi:hypothetical protein